MPVTDDEGKPKEAPAKMAKYAREALHADYPLEMQDQDGLDDAQTLMHKEGLRHAHDQSRSEKARTIATTNKTERNARKCLGQKERRAAQKTPA